MRSDPYGTRTRVAGVKGRSPRPLDDGALLSCGKERSEASPANVLVLRLDRQVEEAEHALEEDVK